jgi:hypothetical protein
LRWAGLKRETDRERRHGCRRSRCRLGDQFFTDKKARS